MQLENMRFVFSGAPARSNKIIDPDSIFAGGPALNRDGSRCGGLCRGVVNTTKRQAPIDRFEVVREVGHSG
jgi:hypothetical protein